MKYIPREYLNKKIKLTRRNGSVVFGRIVEINRTCISFETKSKISLLGIAFIENISLAKRGDISQSSPVENKPKENLRKQDFLYSKWWKHSRVEEEDATR